MLLRKIRLFSWESFVGVVCLENINLTIYC